MQHERISEALPGRGFGRGGGATLHSDTSRSFEKPNSGRIAVKVINHLGDEVMKVSKVQECASLLDGMNNTEFKLLKAPIIEAVLDIDCDLPPGFDLAASEVRLRNLFQDTYPKFLGQLMHEHKIETKPDEPPRMSVRHALQSLQFFQEVENPNRSRPSQH